MGAWVLCALGLCLCWWKSFGVYLTHVLRSSSHVSSQSQCGLALLSPASQCPQGWDGAGGDRMRAGWWCSCLGSGC